ncbi:MAG: hypothetical protein AAFY71_24430 [Bacteroidota bacterium]
MKSKKLNYFLIPTVILIWAYVGASYFGLISWSDDTTNTTPSTGTFLLAEQLPDTFKLRLSYQDPFLINPTVIREEPKRKSIKTTTVGQIRKLTPPKRKPFLSYLGFINKEGSFRKMALLYDGKSTFQLAVGDSILAGEIMAIEPTHITVQMSDTTWTYNRDNQ